MVELMFYCQHNILKFSVCVYVFFFPIHTKDISYALSGSAAAAVDDDAATAAAL
jgi:hypothetical protein